MSGSGYIRRPKALTPDKPGTGAPAVKNYITPAGHRRLTEELHHLWKIERPKLVKSYVGWGAGPRASEYLILAAKAKAILSGSYHVTPEHVRAIAKPVLRHRILTNFNAEADQVTTDAIIDGMIKEIPVEGASAAEKRQMDAVMR